MRTRFSAGVCDPITSFNAAQTKSRVWYAFCVFENSRAPLLVTSATQHSGPIAIDPW